MVLEYKQIKADKRPTATTPEEMLAQEAEDEAVANDFSYSKCEDEGVRKQALIVSYYSDYTAFASEIENVVMPRMCELLGSQVIYFLFECFGFLFLLCKLLLKLFNKHSD